MKNHYIIDGYNLLFRLSVPEEDFTKARSDLIEKLNYAIEGLKIDVTMVFDAHKQMEAAIKTRYKHLDIVYTTKGQTADEFLLNCLDSYTPYERKVIVTSDKKLTRKIKEKGGLVTTIEEFLLFLSKRRKKIPKKTGHDNFQSSFDRYLAVFEERFKKGEEF